MYLSRSTARSSSALPSPRSLHCFNHQGTGIPPTTRSIGLNTALAKKPAQCLEYVVAHELAHLLERHHNERFLSLMDTHIVRADVFLTQGGFGVSANRPVS